MEKLQAALARAREKRGDSEPIPVSARNQRSSKQTKKGAAVSERWAELKAFDPSTKRLQQSRIFSGEATSDAQHFDILRTKLLLEMRKHNWTRIAITSATPGSGKTTTVCNLIAGLVRQPEMRGILFDLDFRRPAVSKFFGVAPTASLEDVFSGNVDFSEQAMRLGENTAISMTPKAIKDPAQLLMHSMTSEVLDRIQTDYQPDIMLFDLPPVLVSDESRAFFKLVDAVLIVASAGTNSISEIDEVEREVAQYSNVAGIVLNKCRYMQDGYGYSY